MAAAMRREARNCRRSAAASLKRGRTPACRWCRRSRSCS
jgi:hypothetical protein